MIHEYAFDATLTAVVRVKAHTEAEARKKLASSLDCATMRISGEHESDPSVWIPECSCGSDDPEGLPLIEVDGKGCVA